MSRGLNCYYKKHTYFSADIKEEDKSLVIKNVIPADEGIYICEAHNGVGQISAKAQLVVNCKCNTVNCFCFFACSMHATSIEMSLTNETHANQITFQVSLSHSFRV